MPAAFRDRCATTHATPGSTWRALEAVRRIGALPALLQAPKMLRDRPHPWRIRQGQARAFMSATDLDRSLVLEAVRVTEAAAIAAWKLRLVAAAKGGWTRRLSTACAHRPQHPRYRRRDRHRRRRARRAPAALHLGEKVGRGRGAQDRPIALDPLEGTTLTAKAMANALAVMAWAPKGTC